METEFADILINDVHSTLEKFPGLNVLYKNDKPNKLIGNIVIQDDQQIYQGDYDVEILIPQGYPYEFPRMFETGNKIERIADRHIDKYGEACLEIDVAKFLEARKGITILRFTEHYVYKYLCGQIYYVFEKQWPSNEWRHSAQGQYDFFSEYFRTTDLRKIIYMLGYILYKPKLIRTNYCICGCNKKYRNCHKVVIEPLYDFNREILKSIIESLQTLYLISSIKG